MATVDATIDRVGKDVCTITWVGMGSADIGEWVCILPYKQINAHVFGHVRTFALEGANNAGGTNPYPLQDREGVPIAGDGIFEVGQVPGFIRPNLSSGSHVSVTLVCR